MLGAAPATADSSSPSAYRDAVQLAYDTIATARSDDPTPAQSALAILESGTGGSEREIIADLSNTPPDYVDARARLTSLLAALDNPASTTDPTLAQQRLHRVLAMNRYDALRRPPSLFDRFVQWLRDRLADLLRSLQSRGVPPIPGWVLSAIGVSVLIAAATLVFRSASGRVRETVIATRILGPRPAADHFADADRLNAAGDRVAAIRALCAGVAASIAGARSWEGSPLTVREIFRRAHDDAQLGPLLQPFEAAVYGGHEVDVETYARAEQAAAPFRSPVAEAA